MSQFTHQHNARPYPHAVQRTNTNTHTLTSAHGSAHAAAVESSPSPELAPIALETPRASLLTCRSARGARYAASAAQITAIPERARSNCSSRRETCEPAAQCPWASTRKRGTLHAPVERAQPPPPAPERQPKEPSIVGAAPTPEVTREGMRAPRTPSRPAPQTRRTRTPRARRRPSQRRARGTRPRRAARTAASRATTRPGARMRGTGDTPGPRSRR